jgi:hypothetical protein
MIGYEAFISTNLFHIPVITIKAPLPWLGAVQALWCRSSDEAEAEAEAEAEGEYSKIAIIRCGQQKRSDSNSSESMLY